MSRSIPYLTRFAKKEIRCIIKKIKLPNKMTRHVYILMFKVSCDGLGLSGVELLIDKIIKKILQLNI